MHSKREGNRLARAFQSKWLELTAEILVRLIGLATYFGVKFNVDVTVTAGEWDTGINVSTEYLLRKYANQRPREIAYPAGIMAACLVVPALCVPLLMLACYIAISWPLERKQITNLIRAQLKKYILAMTATVIFTLLWVEITKKFVGRARPDYFFGCNPHFQEQFESLVNDPFGFKHASERYPLRPHCDYTQSQRKWQDASMSFPSGHAALSIGVYLFMALWTLHLFKPFKALRGPLIWCSIMAMIFPAVISYSRITQNRHHPSDVVFGIIFGAFFAIFSFWYYYGRSETMITTQPTDDDESQQVYPSLQALKTHDGEIRQP